jgi:hypothetical protein
MLEDFNKRSLAGRIIAVVVLAVSLVLVGAAERDIQRRAPDEMRGNKALWRLLCLNALGAIGYFTWGRRPS